MACASGASSASSLASSSAVDTLRVPLTLMFTTAGPKRAAMPAMSGNPARIGAPAVPATAAGISGVAWAWLRSRWPAAVSAKAARAMTERRRWAGIFTMELRLWQVSGDMAMAC